MPAQAELPSGRQASGTAADHCDVLAGGGQQFGGFHILGQATEFLHGHRFVQGTTAASVHAEIWTDLTADAGRERRVVQYQFQGFFGLAFAQQGDAVLGWNACRTGSLTRGGEGLILPVRDLQSTVTGVNKASYLSVVVSDYVAEDAAFNPLVEAKFAHGDAFHRLSLLVGLGNNLLPWGEVGQLA